jgi:hypothetical protein
MEENDEGNGRRGYRIWRRKGMGERDIGAGDGREWEKGI